MAAPRQHSEAGGGERRLCVCIDDLGLHPGICAAALQLVEAGRVHALGCLVGAPAWPAAAAALRRLPRGAVDLGLHLDLTEFPLDAAWRQPLRRLVLRSLLGRLGGAAAQAQLRVEIRVQLDAFEAAIGRAPDFVDGHRHVHQLPGVRDALVAELATRCRAGARPWLRSTRSGAGRWAFKPRLIEALGAAGLTRLAAREGFAQNARLLGVYGFGDDATGYRRRLARWLAAARSGDLLMCHPGLGPTDALHAARNAEFAVWSAPLPGPEAPGAARPRFMPMSRILAAAAPPGGA